MPHADDSEDGTGEYFGDEDDFTKHVVHTLASTQIAWIGSAALPGMHKSAGTKIA